MSFKDLQLNKPILKAVAESGYDTPTLIQAQTIPLVLAKKDVIASAQTGTGKTAAFALPILQLLFDKQDATKNGKNPNSSSCVRFAFGSGITTEFAATNDSLSFAMSIFKIFGTRIKT